MTRIILIRRNSRYETKKFHTYNEAISFAIDKMKEDDSIIRAYYKNYGEIAMQISRVNGFIVYYDNENKQVLI